MPPFNPPESYCPPSTCASGWHVKPSKKTGDAIPYFIGECKTPRPLASSSANGEASGSNTTLFMYLGALKPEHRHWSPTQTFPIELVRKAVDELLLREKEDARLNEMD